MEKKGIKKMMVVGGVSGVAGAVMGMLFAPKKGSDIRKDIKTSLDKVVNKVKSIKTEDVKKAFEKQIKNIEKSLDSLSNEKEIKKVRKKAKELKNSVEELWNSVYEKGDEILEKAVEELKEKVNKVVDKIEKEENK